MPIGNKKQKINLNDQLQPAGHKLQQSSIQWLNKFQSTANKHKSDEVKEILLHPSEHKGSKHAKSINSGSLKPSSGGNRFNQKSVSEIRNPKGCSITSGGYYPDRPSALLPALSALSPDLSCSAHRQSEPGPFHIRASCKTRRPVP